MSESVKRSYHSKVRAAAAVETRERIRDSAAELFAQQGYTATTVKQIAEAAGVGERTLYDIFDNKQSLFRYVVNVLTRGDEEDTLIIDRPAMREARETEDPRRAIELHVEFGAALMERAGDLIMASLEVSGSIPDLGAIARRGLTGTHEIHLALTKRLAERGQLRPELDADTAADVLYALSSPAVYQALVRHRGWTTDEYRRWLTDAAIAQLLASD